MSSSRTRAQQDTDLKRRGFPRGHFYEKPEWTNDHDSEYFPDLKSKYFWPLLKLLILLAIGYLLKGILELTWQYTILSCLAFIGLY